MANPLESFKKLPTWGKGAVVLGGVAVAYYAYKAHESSSAASASSASGTDPVTGLPYSMDNETDPETGMTYLAEAQEYGSVAAAESAYSSGALGYGGSAGNFSTGLASPESYTNTESGAITTAGYSSDDAWAQAVETGLTDIGYTSTDVSDALGAWMAGQPLTADQASIVQAAIAEFGEPPTGNFPIIRAATSTPTGSGTTTTTGSGSGTTTTTSTPVTTPKTPSKPAMPSGVTGTALSGTEVSLKWNPVAGATSYNIRVTYQDALVESGTATTPYRIVNGLKPNQTYTFHVAAVNSAGTSSETNGPAVKTLSK